MLKKMWQEGQLLWAEFSRTNASTHASSACYFSFLSLVPLLAICISLVTMTGVSQEQVIGFFGLLIPDALKGFANTLISDAFDRSGLALSLSSLTLLWSASKGIKALRSGLNAAYYMKENRNAVLVAIISIVSVLLLGVMLAATMYLMFGNSVLHALANMLPNCKEADALTTALNWLGTFVLGTFAINVCYTFLPAGNRPFLAQLPGAALASVGGALFTLGFHIYVDHFSNFTVLYGSIATVALFLFWMYLTYYILLIGAFTNFHLAARAKRNQRSAR